MQLYGVALCLECGCPDTVLLEISVFVVERLKRDVRVLGQLLQELPLEVFGLPLELEASLELLPLLAIPVRIVEFAVPCAGSFILVSWHLYLPFSGRGGAGSGEDINGLIVEISTVRVIRCLCDTLVDCECISHILILQLRRKASYHP